MFAFWSIIQIFVLFFVLLVWIFIIDPTTSKSIHVCLRNSIIILNWSSSFSESVPISSQTFNKINLTLEASYVHLNFLLMLIIDHIQSDCSFQFISRSSCLLLILLMLMTIGLNYVEIYSNCQYKSSLWVWISMSNTYITN